MRQQLPPAVALAVRVLEHLAPTALEYRSDKTGFHSRARKAAALVERGYAEHRGGGDWLVTSWSRPTKRSPEGKVVHPVTLDHSGPSCPCEARELARDGHARPCIHMIAAAIGQAMHELLHEAAALYESGEMTEEEFEAYVDDFFGKAAA